MGVYDDANGGSVPFQVRDLWKWRDRFVEDHEKWRRGVDNDRRDLHHLIEAFDKQTAAFDGFRKTIIGFAFTIAGSAVVFALSVLIATGKVG